MRPSFVQVFLGTVSALVGTVLVTFFLLGQLPTLLAYAHYPILGACAVVAVVIVGRLLEGLEAATSG